MSLNPARLPRLADKLEEAEAVLEVPTKKKKMEEKIKSSKKPAPNKKIIK